MTETTSADGSAVITLGFASLLPSGSVVGSERAFAIEDLRTEYDGGVAHLIATDEAAATAANMPTSYVLDPIETSSVWSNEDTARAWLDGMNQLGTTPYSPPPAGDAKL